jgi:hypothetical protein
VLLIHKPEHSIGRDILRRQWAVYRSYRANLAAMRRYERTDETVRQLRASKNVDVRDLRVRPLKASLTVTVPRGESKKVRLVYKNHSAVPVFSVATDLHAKPAAIVGTAEPENRESPFWHASWLSKNRLSAWPEQQVNGVYAPVEWIPPGGEFSFPIMLDARNLKRGTYVESLKLVQETMGWLEDSMVRLNVRVV